MDQRSSELRSGQRRCMRVTESTSNAALEKLAKIKVSMHCWQGDDVRGFLNCRSGADRRHLGHGQLSRARRARRMSCAPIWRRRSRSFPASTS